MNCIAIIPARSGSKGLKDKNIMDLNGRPLMYYTIRAALDSGCFQEVMVSTDSPEYARIAKENGAAAPFLRSSDLSGDCAGSWDVVREVLKGYERLGRSFDYVALLQPTSPLRDAACIAGAFEKLNDKSVHNVVSITEVDHPVQWCFRLTERETMDEMAVSPYCAMRRQDLEKHYRENGAIYIVDARKIADPAYNLYADNCAGFVMPREQSIDIDTEMDFKMTELLIQTNKQFRR